MADFAVIKNTNVSTRIVSCFSKNEKFKWIKKWTDKNRKFKKTLKTN